jgi:hypothetical protein
MNKKLAVLLASALPLYLMAAGCSSTPGGADPASSQVTTGSAATKPSAEAVEGTQKTGPYRGTPPANAKVPTVEAPLESHSGDEENFYVDTDDYVVWAKPSTTSDAEREYRVVCFDADGLQTLAFMKFVFTDEAEATKFAKTNDLLIPVANVVYYRGWLGAERQDKAGVIELAKAEGNEYYISLP